MGIIENYLLSLRLTEYQHSLAQIMHIIKAIEQSLGASSELANNALRWADNNKILPIMKTELTLLVKLLLMLGYKPAVYSADELILVERQQRLLITFKQGCFSVAVDNSYCIT
ncbi:hypothetical protein [Pseudoalteromonas mariniglutinosa]|uniref:hypothetical protein n=1 Tax=Pseudoalteromonas mariniglutinosa TaxID=206042 RepID=UPI00384F864F